MTSVVVVVVVQHLYVVVVVAVLVKIAHSRRPQLQFYVSPIGCKSLVGDEIE